MTTAGAEVADRLPELPASQRAAPLRPMSQDDPKVRAAIGRNDTDFAAVPLNDLLD